MYSSATPGGYGHRLAVLEIGKSLPRETPDSPKAEIANAVNAENKANPQMAAPAHGVSGPFAYHLQYTTARLPRHIPVGGRHLTAPIRVVPASNRRSRLAGPDELRQRRHRSVRGVPASAAGATGARPDSEVRCSTIPSSSFETAASPREDAVFHKQFGREPSSSTSVPAPGSLQSFNRAPMRFARSLTPGNRECLGRAGAGPAAVSPHRPSPAFG